MSKHLNMKWSTSGFMRKADHGVMAESLIISLKGFKVAKRRRKFSREFKLSVLREIESGKTIAQASREYELHESMINRWKRQYRENPDKAFSGNGRISKDQAKIAELERTIGQLYLENAFLKKTLEHLEKSLLQYQKRGKLN